LAAPFDQGPHPLRGVLPLDPQQDTEASRFLYLRSMTKRPRFRPPGLKPTTKVGHLGPYRGRLGLGWVIAPIVAGLIIVAAGWLLLFR
jgi:hypothetical protein